MNIQDAIKIQEYIDSNYPGGLKQFFEDGGNFCFVPEPANIFYLIHRDIPKDVRRYLNTMFSNEHIIYGNTLNAEFSPNDMTKIYKALEEVMNKDGRSNLIGVVMGPCVLCITIPTLKKDDESVDVLMDRLANIPGIKRGCLLLSDGVETFEGVDDTEEDPSEGSTEDPEETSVKGRPPQITGRPSRETVINEDDLRNLQIALATANTIEEFLSQV